MWNCWNNPPLLNAENERGNRQRWRGQSTNQGDRHGHGQAAGYMGSSQRERMERSRRGGQVGYSIQGSEAVGTQLVSVADLRE